MAYDESALAMRDLPAIRSFPPRLAVVSSLRADELNAKGLDSRQQQHQNSHTSSAQRASQSAFNGSNYSVNTGQQLGGKRPREQVAALPLVVPSEAGHHPKLARIETEEQSQSQSRQQQQQHLPQFHGQQHQQQLLEQQQFQLLEQEQELQPMDFMGTDDMGMDCSEELLSSSSGAELDTTVQPPPPGMGVRREIFFADFF